ncbi:hypothetical protein ACWEWU_14550 [Staphylococcus xylosus]
MIEGVKNLIEQENMQMTKQEDWYELKFEYLGYTAKVTRYEKYGHLCGYIKIDFEVTDEVYGALEDHSHGGITYDKDNWLGFDCAHAYDFNLDHYWQFEKLGIGAIKRHIQNETYRTLDYVVETLKTMISAMTVERIKQEKPKEGQTK